jgi:hypothetical protein
MYYLFEVDIPPLTTIDNPVSQRVSINQGTVSFIEVHFPSGCAGLVRAAIDYNSIQLLPWNKDASLYGDNRLYKVDLNLPLAEPPYEFVVRGWSDDDTYPHTISIGIMLIETSEKSILQLLLGK